MKAKTELRAVKVYGEVLELRGYHVESESAEINYRLGVLAEKTGGGGASFQLPEDLEVRIFRKPYQRKPKAYVGTKTQIAEYDEAFKISSFYCRVNGLKVPSLLGARPSSIHKDDLAYGAFSKAIEEGKKAVKFLHGAPEEDLIKEYTETVKISARVPRELTDYKSYGYESFNDMVVAGLKYVTGSKR